MRSIILYNACFAPPFLWARKIQGAALLRAYWYKKTLRNMAVFLCCIITRARIGLEITRPACLCRPYGKNRARLRRKRVLAGAGVKNPRACRSYGDVLDLGYNAPISKSAGIFKP